MAIKNPSAGKSAQKKKIKRAKRDIHIRQGVQLGFLALFLLTVLQANYPFAPWIPPELFLWMDPLTAIVVQVAARAFIPMFLLSLIVLVLPFVLGRSFCGWVCPLGTLVDIGDRIVARKDRIGRKLRPFKTWALVAFVVAALFGFSAVWLLDPLPLIWRTFGGAIFPGITWGLNAAFDTSLVWGYDPDWLFNVFDFLSLHVLPLKAHAVAGAWFIFVFFLVILGLSFFQRRFWCRNLCPLGALLGLLSKFSPLQRVVKSGTCTNCELCSKECKMGAIEDDFVTTEKSECIFCLNCAAQCRAGETVYTFRSPTEMQSEPDMKRRSFVAATGVGLIGAGMVNLGQDPDERDKYYIRPPGATPEEVFLDRCIRCNECVRICATTGRCLQPTHFEAGFAAFWSPIASFKEGYCEYNCNLCGEICPTEAILNLPLETKKTRKMGLAVINEETCIPFDEKQNCMVCEEFCPTPEKAIVFDHKTIEKDGQPYDLKEPRVVRDLCIGCGLCEKVCPVEGTKAVLVVRETEERFLT